LVIFIETGLVAMPFLPGDSLLFTAGLFAASGDLNLSALLILLFIAAVLGDNCNYWIGRKVGLRVFTIKFKGRQLVNEKYLVQTEAFFEKRGVFAIIMARFVPIVRTFTPFAAGIGKMIYQKFLLFDVIGGFLWIFSMTFAGYFLGKIAWVEENLEKVVEDLKKFRWQFAAIISAGLIIISVIPTIRNIIIPETVTIQEIKK
jgi:membrane-associated protein